MESFVKEAIASREEEEDDSEDEQDDMEVIADQEEEGDITEKEGVHLDDEQDIMKMIEPFDDDEYLFTIDDSMNTNKWVDLVFSHAVIKTVVKPSKDREDVVKGFTCPSCCRYFEALSVTISSDVGKVKKRIRDSAKWFVDHFRSNTCSLSKKSRKKIYQSYDKYLHEEPNERNLLDGIEETRGWLGKFYLKVYYEHVHRMPILWAERHRWTV